MTAVAAAFGGVSGGTGEQQAIYDLFNTNAASVFVGGSGSSASPKAYLNYILFDQDFNYVDAGFAQVSNTANTHQALTLSRNITEGGYIYVYVSNESNTSFDVFFDDVRVTHSKGNILQEDHYYPFGLSINALSSTAPLSKPNQFKFNAGTEFNSDFNFNIYETQFRGYDSQLGRFNQVDPLADLFTDWTPYQFAYNDPIYWNDPLGLANQNGDSTWVSESSLLQYLWDNTPENGSASFEIVNYNPYGDEYGRVFTPEGVDIYLESEYAVRTTSTRRPSSNTITTSRTEDQLDYYQTLVGFHGLLYGAAENYHQPAGNLWRGSNGKYYNTSWGGNQYTGGRNAIVRSGKFFRVAGQWVAVGGVALDIIDLKQGNISTGEFMMNSAMTAYGVFGGPVGWITSGAYFVMANTYGDQQAINFQQSMTRNRANGTLSHPKAGSYSGRNLPKSRNPKF